VRALALAVGFVLKGGGCLYLKLIIKNIIMKKDLKGILKKWNSMVRERKKRMKEVGEFSKEYWRMQDERHLMMYCIRDIENIIRLNTK